MPTALDALKGTLEVPSIPGEPTRSAMDILKASLKAENPSIDQNEMTLMPDIPGVDAPLNGPEIPKSSMRAFIRGFGKQQMELGGLIPNAPERAASFIQAPFTAEIPPEGSPQARGLAVDKEGAKLTESEVALTNQLATRHPNEFALGQDVGRTIDTYFLLQGAKMLGAIGVEKGAAYLGKKFPDNLIFQSINRGLSHVREFGLDKEVGAKIVSDTQLALAGAKRNREVGIVKEFEVLQTHMANAEIRTGSTLTQDVQPVLRKHATDVAVDTVPLLKHIENTLTKDGTLRIDPKTKKFFLDMDAIRSNPQASGLVGTLQSLGGVDTLNVMKKGGKPLPMALKDATRMLSNLSKQGRYAKGKISTLELGSRRARMILRDQVVREIASVNPADARIYDQAMKIYSENISAINEVRDVVTRSSGARASAGSIAKVGKSEGVLARELDQSLDYVTQKLGPAIPSKVRDIRNLQNKIDLLDSFPSDPVALERMLFKLDDKDMISMVQKLETIAKTEGFQGRAIAKMIPNLRAAITARKIHEPLASSIRTVESFGEGGVKTGFFVSLGRAVERGTARAVLGAGRPITVQGKKAQELAAKGVSLVLAENRIAKEFSRNEYLANAYLTKMPKELQADIIKLGANAPSLQPKILKFFRSKVGVLAIGQVMQVMFPERFGGAVVVPPSDEDLGSVQEVPSSTTGQAVMPDRNVPMPGNPNFDQFQNEEDNPNVQ